MSTQIHRLETGWQLAVYDSVTSTSDVIMTHPEACEGFAVLARQQTKGRGRQGRPWASELDDGMYLSLALSPTRPTAEWPTLSFVAALSLFHALKHLFPDLPAGLKWPNDVLINRGKVSGLLLEARQDRLVLGCGVNLKNAPQLEGARFAPTDLLAQTGKQTAPEELALCFLSYFYDHYQNWLSAGFLAQIDLYRSHLLFVGEPISVSHGAQVLEGIMIGMSDKGDLLLEDGAGQIKSVTTGDVNLIGFSNATRD